MNEEYRNYDSARSIRGALDETTLKLEEMRVQQEVANNYLRLHSRTHRLIRGDIAPLDRSNATEQPQRNATTFVVLPRGNRQDRPHWLIELYIPKLSPT